MGVTVNKLLDLPANRPPDTCQARITRLGLDVTLREISFNKLMRLRGTEDADVKFLLESIQEPDVKDPAWWREHMGCPTPVEALKKLLKKGEIEKLCRLADQLNGFGPGQVIAVNREPEELFDAAVGGALEDLQKN